MFYTIWASSIVLCVVTVTIMLHLVALRALEQVRERRLAPGRKAYRDALLTFSRSRNAEALRAAIAATHPDILIDDSFDFLARIRGDVASDLLDHLRASGVPAKLHERMARGSATARERAAELVVSFPAPETVAALNRALQDHVPEVRLASAISLAKLGAIKSLGDVLKQVGRQGLVSRRTIEFFSQIAESHGGALRQIAADPSILSMTRVAAIEALTRDRSPQVVLLLVTLARDSDPAVAAAGLRGLGLIAHPRGVEVIREQLFSPHWQVRTEAAIAAGAVAWPGADSLLVELLGDKEWAVRYGAGRSLLRLGKKGRSRLVLIARTGSGRGQRTALSVLAEPAPL
jgi:HEAT repeat protein